MQFTILIEIIYLQYLDQDNNPKRYGVIEFDEIIIL